MLRKYKSTLIFLKILEESVPQEYNCIPHFSVAYIEWKHYSWFIACGNFWIIAETTSSRMTYLFEKKKAFYQMGFCISWMRATRSELAVEGFFPHSIMEYPTKRFLGNYWFLGYGVYKKKICTVYSMSVMNRPDPDMTLISQTRNYKNLRFL